MSGDQNSGPKSDPKTWGMSTRLVRGGTTRSQHMETSEAIFLTSGFTYHSAAEADARFAGDSPGYVYGRYGNPTLKMLEDRLALMEGAEACRVMSSGMAAVAATMLAQLKTGDVIVGSRALFFSCRWIIETFMPKFGVEARLVDGDDLDQWRAALPGAKLVFLESPSNPMLGLVDIAAVCDLAKKAGAQVVVDNVFASPMLQKPLELGADLVVYSSTKHIDGQGRTLGGAVLGKADHLKEAFEEYMRHIGPALSPFNAWVQLKGLETLGLRVDRMTQTAHTLAERLEGHAKLESVIYPFLKSHPQYALAKRQMKAGGTLLAFTIKGGRQEAWRFLDALRIIDISNNLGDSKSLATHPVTTTHRKLPDDEKIKLGVREGTVRVSVGLEDSTDLIDDVLQALERV
jgi:O-succinylhomoserine sulfhydrylase